jgi:hypothetical protein
MSEYRTTADYLATFRDELASRGFAADEVWILVEFAAKQIIANDGLGVAALEAVSS